MPCKACSPAEGSFTPLPAQSGAMVAHACTADDYRTNAAHPSPGGGVLPSVPVADLRADTEYLVSFDFQNGLVRNYLAVWRVAWNGESFWDDHYVFPAHDCARFFRMWEAKEAVISVYQVP